MNVTGQIWVREAVVGEAPMVWVSVNLTGIDEYYDLTPCDVEWSTDEGRNWNQVRQGSGVWARDLLRRRSITDYLCPLNVEAIYRLTYGGRELARATILVTSPVAWLQNPLSPRQQIKITCGYLHQDHGEQLVLLSESFSGMTWTQDADLARVMGARRPDASLSRRLSLSDIKLHFRDIAAAQGALKRQVHELFEDAGTIALRGHPHEKLLTPAVLFLQAKISPVPTPGNLLGPRFDWVLDCEEVGPEALSINVPYWTYAQVRNAWHGWTYAQVKLARPGLTYEQWRRQSGEGPRGSSATYGSVAAAWPGATYRQVIDARPGDTYADWEKNPNPDGGAR